MAANPELTPFQVKALARLAAGRTVKGLALDFGKSEAAVQDHKKQIFRKLGVKTCAQAVAEGFRRGLLK